MGKFDYARERARQAAPCAGGRRYRAVEVKKLDRDCAGCAASRGGGQTDKALCNALAPCTRERRLDGRNVVFQEAGPAGGEG